MISDLANIRCRCCISFIEVPPNSHLWNYSDGLVSAHKVNRPFSDGTPGTLFHIGHLLTIKVETVFELTPRKLRSLRKTANKFAKDTLFGKGVLASHSVSIGMKRRQRSEHLSSLAIYDKCTNTHASAA